MTITSMTTKGQVVIPSAIRKRLNITRSTRLCVLESGGKVILQPITEDYFDEVAEVLNSKGQLLRDLLEERRKEKAREDRP